MAQPEQELPQDEGIEDISAHEPELVQLLSNLLVDVRCKWDLLDYFTCFLQYAELHTNQKIHTTAIFSHRLEIGEGEQLDHSITLRAPAKLLTLPLPKWYNENVVHPIANYMQRYGYIELQHLSFSV